MSETTADVDVLVIGEALMDIVDTGSWASEHVGGSPANVAVGLGRRGVDVALLSQVGRDPRGEVIADHLRTSGVRLLAESFSAPRTSTALVTVGSDGQPKYDFDVHWGPLPAIAVPTPRVVHSGSVATLLEPAAHSVRRLIAATDASEVTFDPNVRPALLGTHSAAVECFTAMASSSSVVKMSDEDARWLFPRLDLHEVLDAILALGPRLAVVTLGPRGAILACSAARVTVPAPLVRAVDTIGAGDTFMASLIHSLLRLRADSDMDAEVIRAMGERAVAAAAVTVSRKGADLPWSTELESEPALEDQSRQWTPNLER